VATRRSVTQEYRDQAVSLHLDSGRLIAEVARSIGVHEMTLGKWVKKVKDSGRVQEVYAKASLKKYRPMVARNEDKKVFSGLL
jgi:transposase